MLFSTPTYIFLFLPLTFIIHLALLKWNKAVSGDIWLIAASFFFYSYTASQYLPLLIASIAVNFYLGKAISKISTYKTYRGKKNLHSNVKCKILLLAGILFNIALLAYFKYADFFILNIKLISSVDIPLLKLTLPLAISFFTFQQIAFLVDCHHKKTEERDFLTYCFFVMFFPQLIAGPIVRHREIIPQLSNIHNRVLNWSNITTGLFVFSIGLFKKVIIADSFSVWADTGFKTGEALGFFEAWGTSLSYTFQLYFDFSGYSDMAIGAALLFNIRLPVNFNSPYKAVNIQDFWRRWHITLSRWLRDYLYIPLGGNRRGAARTLIHILITFFLAGLWHGAGWTFMVWGTMHGIGLALHRVWQQRGFRLPRILGWLCTFLFINSTWVFFRAPSLSDALRVLRGMFSGNFETPKSITDILGSQVSWELISIASLDGPFMMTTHLVAFIVCIPLLVFCIPNSMQIVNFLPYSGIFTFKTNIKTAIYLAVLLFISFLTFAGNVSQSQFLYFNF